jgi:tRNA (mo5U34)-methyltransferase
VKDEVASVDLSPSVLYQKFVPRFSREETLEKIEPVRTWYHTMYFGHGIFVRGMRDPFGLLRRLNLPVDLHGKSVLDVGTSNGFFSFECEARGAGRVLAIDLPGGQWGGNTLAFNVARELLGSTVEFREIDLYDLNENSFERFDVVLFLGVFYHLKDPFLALRKLRKITKQLMILESHIISIPLVRLAPFGDQELPIAVFYEKDELDNDPSNWWGPNISCLVSLLKAAGFAKIEVAHVDIPPRSWKGRAIVKAEV